MLFGGKKTFGKLLDANMSFVFLFCEQKYDLNMTYEEWLNEYKKWLKEYTSPKSDIEKEKRK